MPNKMFAAVFSLAILLVGLPRVGLAQGLPPMGMPIPTTLTVTKPAPDQTYGGKQVITLGVGDKVYKFILKDASTNSFKIRWPDIWQYVQQFNPNLVVQGQDADTFAKIQPGQTMKISGAFAAMDRTFEVLTVEPSSDENHY